MNMNNYIMRDNPCRRECPDRQPGCNCEKRQAFQVIKAERKENIRKHKARESMLDKMAMPKDVLKNGRK